MKRIGKLYGRICSLDNCKCAILSASTGKTKRREVREALEQLDARAAELHVMLTNRTFTPLPYRRVVRADGLKHKRREIQVPQFWPDQCVHHALMRVLAPPLERRMYFWSCGGLKNRGIKRAKRGIERATLKDQRHATYAVQLDVRHCYASIENSRLMACMERIVKDKSTLWLIRQIVESCDGLPIGNYTSPWLCNMYLTPLDRYITDTLKPRYYVRYMDDMVLLDSNKRKLRKAADAIIAFSGRELGLELHKGATVYKVRRDGEPKNHNRAVDFVGYRFCLGYTVLRRRNALALMRNSRRVQRMMDAERPIPFSAAAGFISRAGQLTHCKAEGLAKKYVQTAKVEKLKEVIRHEGKRQSAARGGVPGGAAPTTGRDCHRDRV